MTCTETCLLVAHIDFKHMMSVARDCVDTPTSHDQLDAPGHGLRPTCADLHSRQDSARENSKPQSFRSSAGDVTYPSAASAPPCHSQSPSKGPPKVETVPVAGSIFNTDDAFDGSAKQAPLGNSSSPAQCHKQGKTGPARSVMILDYNSKGC